MTWLAALVAFALWLSASSSCHVIAFALCLAAAWGPAFCFAVASLPAIVAGLCIGAFAAALASLSRVAAAIGLAVTHLATLMAFQVLVTFAAAAATRSAGLANARHSVMRSTTAGAPARAPSPVARP